jgi:hypothetical protein
VLLRKNRKIVLTQKFVDGMALYKQLWKVTMILACEPADTVSDNLDDIEINLDSARSKPFVKK